MKIEQTQAGLLVGILFGFSQLVWALIVGSGLGQVMATYFLFPGTLPPFDVVTALIGIIGAFVMGYVVGYASAWIWNMMPGEKKKR